MGFNMCPTSEKLSGCDSESLKVINVVAVVAADES